ncbi:MAG: hypothetical protein MK213_03395, partial [Planctomycetes bacterium]|nr:hypothetical protein [Planctomycetota bacterium]
GDRPLQLERRLQALDGEVQRGMQPSYAMRLAVLYGPYVEEELDPDRRTLPVREFTQVATEIFRQLQIRARLPRHELVRAGRILTAQIRMDPPPWSRHQAPRKKDARWLLDQEWRDEAIRYLGLRLMADKRDLKMHRDWEERALSFKAGDR